MAWASGHSHTELNGPEQKWRGRGGEDRLKTNRKGKNRSTIFIIIHPSSHTFTPRGVVRGRGGNRGRGRGELSRLRRFSGGGQVHHLSECAQIVLMQHLWSPAPSPRRLWHLYVSKRSTNSVMFSLHTCKAPPQDLHPNTEPRQNPFFQSHLYCKKGFTIQIQKKKSVNNSDDSNLQLIELHVFILDICVTCLYRNICSRAGR